MGYGKKYSKQPKNLMGRRSKSSKPVRKPFLTRARFKGGDNFNLSLVAPNDNPATVSRQVLRKMLREKGRRDLIQQYGRGKVSLGYDPNFPRRIRRRVQMAMQSRWFKQIVAEQNAAETKSETKPTGVIAGLVRKFFNRKETGNTLAASGVGA